MRPCKSFWAATFLSLSPLFCQSAAAQDTLVAHADNAPTWGAAPRLVEEMRIGTLDGDVNYAFGSVGGVAVMDDGTIWVGDRHLSAIRRFDSDGVYIDQIGREGEGPGEFQYPFGMRPLRDGSVAVWDDGQLRVSRFDASGDFLDSFRPATVMIGSSNLEELETDTEGHLYLIALTGLTERPRRLFWIKMRPNGEVLDSIYLPSSEQEGTVDPIRTTAVLSPLGYLVTARNDDYVVHRPLPDRRILRIERSWTPVPYQRAERAEKQRLERGFSERNGRSPRRIPEHKPPFSYVEVDTEGRLWVQMYARGYVEPETPGEQALRERYDGLLREWRQPFICEVIEPNGRYLGRLQFPTRRTDVVVARGRHVWVIEKGLFDEPYVVRYRIEPGDSANENEHHDVKWTGPPPSWSASWGEALLPKTSRGTRGSSHRG